MMIALYLGGHPLLVLFCWLILWVLCHLLPLPPPQGSLRCSFVMLAVHLLADAFQYSCPSSCPSTRLRWFSSQVRQQRLNMGELMHPGPADHCKCGPFVLLVSLLALTLQTSLAASCLQTFLGSSIWPLRLYPHKKNVFNTWGQTL